MAKILFKATGKVEHVEANTAHLFVASGAAEYVMDPPAKIEVRWSLYKEELGNTGNSSSLVFVCGHCKSTTYFIPDVNLGAKKIVEVVHPHCVHKTPCPMEIADAYVTAGGGQPLPKYELDGPAVNKEQAEAFSRPRTF
jgi:hypothetical protein